MKLTALWFWADWPCCADGCAYVGYGPCCYELHAKRKLPRWRVIDVSGVS